MLDEIITKGTPNTLTQAMIDKKQPILSQFLQQQGITFYALYIERFEQQIHVLTLTQSNNQNCFNQQTHHNALFLLENVARAFDHHLKLKLKSIWQYNDSYKAICDLKGQILTCDIEFEQFIHQHSKQNLLHAIASTEDKTQFTNKPIIDNYKIDINVEANLYHIEIYPYDPNIEQLSKTETQIAQGLIKGMTAQQIADDRNAAYKTVTNQINSIYKKLYVSNNAELVNFLLNSNYRRFRLDSTAKKQ